MVAVRAAAAPERLREAAVRTRPVVLAGERTLPVLPALSSLLPDGGLRRGATVCVGGGSAASSLALALVAGASALGSWCAAVGWPSVGLVAAAELGVTLERFPLVAMPGSSGSGSGEWATIVAALLDAFDVVLVRPPRLRLGDVRRLSARARERGAVLVFVDAGSVEGADVRLTTERAEWRGLGDGHGHLTGRVVDVVAGGRGAASRPRRARLWLPAPGGGVRVCESATELRPVSGREHHSRAAEREVG